MADGRINSLVVFDLETTGLPWQQHRITELALVAASREHVLATQRGVPRVAHKLTLCLDPRRQITAQAAQLTDLSNELLKNERIFDKDVCDMVNLFFSRLARPVCLVAHNGMKFDFPLFKKEIMQVDKMLPDDILCVDSYIAFRDIFSKPSLPTCLTSSPGCDTSFNSAEEKPQMQGLPQDASTNGVKRRKSQENNSQTQLKSFKLDDIYRYLYGTNAINSHRAENDAVTLFACISIRGKDFIDWADVHAVPFNKVKS